MLLETRVMCPYSWKFLFMLHEHDITFTQKIITLSEEIQNNIKYPKIDRENSLSYFFEHIDHFISKSEYNILGIIFTEIEGYFINQILLPIRFERVIKPLVHRQIANIQTLNLLRNQLQTNLKEYSLFIEKNTCKYYEIVLSTAIAVLDYLGEIPWHLIELETLYHWYLKIKSKKTFQIILEQLCPGIQPHTKFTQQDF